MTAHSDYEAQDEAVAGLRVATGLRYEAARRWADDGSVVVELATSKRATRRLRYAITPDGAVASFIEADTVAW